MEDYQREHAAAAHKAKYLESDSKLSFFCLIETYSQ